MPLFLLGRNASQCDAVYYSTSARISSKGFPNLPSNRTSCVYTIQPVGNSSQIAIQFTRFYLPNNENNCQQNYLTIATQYESLDTGRRYCGSQIPDLTTWKSPTVYLKLVIANYFGQDGGFSLFYNNSFGKLISLHTYEVTTSFIKHDLFVLAFHNRYSKLQCKSIPVL